MAEGPYKLPKGWKWVRLGEVCEINPRRPRLVRNDDAPTSFVPMNAVDENTGTIIEIQVRPFAEVKSGYRYFQEGDVLFAKITPCMENGKAAIARGLIDGIGFGSTEFHVLRPKREVMAEWIWLFVRQERFREDAKANFRGGVGQQRVPQEFLVRYSIPLPPLPEQRRIVARIEELMERVREARRLREEAKKDADRLMQAALAEVFPRPGAPIPPGWRWAKLGEVAHPVNGFGFPKKFQGHKDLPYPFIKVSDFNRPGNETLITHAENYVDEKILRRINAQLYPSGTVIFPKIGGAIATNKKRMLATPASFDNNIMGLIPTDTISGGYLFYFVQSIDLRTLSQIGPVPSIRQSTIKNLQLPLPPLPEQRRIVAYLDQVQARVTALKKAQKSTEAELHRLEQAILDQAFKGKL